MLRYYEIRHASDKMVMYENLIKELIEGIYAKVSDRTVLSKIEVWIESTEGWVRGQPQVAGKPATHLIFYKRSFARPTHELGSCQEFLR